jgi:hypothetical protein
VTVVLGGYAPVALTRREAWQSASVPDPYLTISTCAKRDPWLPPYAGWFADRSEAQQVLSGLPEPAELLAVGIRISHQAEIASWFGRSQVDHRTVELLQRGLPLPVDAVPLGHEVVGWEWAGWHSWHCHDLVDAVQAELGVGINRLGLIEDPRDAERVVDWIYDLPPEAAAEPVPWSVVMLSHCEPGVGG